MIIARIQDSEHDKPIGIPKDKMNYESKSTSFGSMENDYIEVVSLTQNVDDIILATESVLDAALETLFKWDDDLPKR